ncbi:hypothetical protein [Pantoea vagans]|uniref:hypothetical protein n=1 Tax=Pantoea vagans TaxID=470934 RepID=UPI0023B13FCF|nr:hypothetical protein [Pantoea vagans]MDE8559261.1 hypothetical protein [Pantoea vagans]MDE8579261.1 hypothetical protein [Pantoea vagans]
MDQSESHSDDLLIRASARFTSKNSTLFIALLSLFLYMGSDFLSKLFLSNVPVAWIALFRFSFGLPLLFFSTRDAFKSSKALTFAGANVVNSVCGVYAIVAGSLSGFALAGQLRPVFLILFSAIVFNVRYSLKSWLLFLLIISISFLIFRVDSSVGLYANYIYILSVAFQAFVFAGLSREQNNLVNYLAVYNFCGFILTLIYILYNKVPAPDAIKFNWMAISGALAMAGSILNIISLSTPFRLEVSSVSYIRLPLTLLLSGLFMGETILLSTWICCISVLFLVYLLSKTSAKIQ